MHLDGKVSAPIDDFSGLLLVSVLRVLCILYAFELFLSFGNHIVDHADDITIYIVIPRPLSLPQVMESLNQELAAINAFCLKWHMRLNLQKTKSKMVNIR